MLVKQLTKRITLLGPGLSFSLTSKLSQSNPDNDDTPPSKHNPQAIKDLRGHHNLDQLTEAQKAYSPILSTTYNHLASYHLFSLLP